MKYEVRVGGMKYEVGTAAGHTSLKLRAAGIETESPKCEGKCVDGLVVNSPQPPKEFKTTKN